MRVLLTRPRAAAERLAQDLAARGHEVLIEPLLTIEPLPGPLPDLAGVQALVITSAHAVPALAGTDPRLPVFVVGSATAAAARAAGRRDVRVGEGDARALARLIARQLRPADGALLHLSGSEVRPELGQDLAAAGLRAAPSRRSIGRAPRRRCRPKSIVDALRAGRRRRGAAVLAAQRRDPGRPAGAARARRRAERDRGDLPQRGGGGALSAPAVAHPGRRPPGGRDGGWAA